MSPRLTDSQRELVEQQLWVARWVAKTHASYARDRSEYDDFLSAAYLGLCEAALTFDRERGLEFVTYARWKCRDQILRVIALRSLIRAPWYRQPHKIRSIDADTPERQADQSEQDVREERVLAIAALPDRQRFVIEQLMQGRTQRDIGRELGLTHQRVQQIYSAARQRLRQWLRIAS